MSCQINLRRKGGEAITISFHYLQLCIINKKGTKHYRATHLVLPLNSLVLLEREQYAVKEVWPRVHRTKEATVHHGTWWQKVTFCGAFTEWSMYPYSIPFYCHIIFHCLDIPYLSFLKNQIHQLMDIWIVSNLLSVMNYAAMNIQVYVSTYIFIPPG